MRSKPVLTILGICLSYNGLAQNNALTGSPYSYFGLGVPTSANVGINNSMGMGGSALHDGSHINILNPASLAIMEEKNFIFDFGFLTEINSLSNRGTNENRVAGNFSSLAFAANLNASSSIGISITPFSEVGYALLGSKEGVDGTPQNFVSNIVGSGALNDFRISYGHKLGKNLRTGLYFSWLFGTIEERESISEAVIRNESGLIVTETNSYSGIRLGFGLQYDLTKDFSLALGVDMPTRLSGIQDRLVRKTIEFSPVVVENERDIDIESFELPLEINTGIFIKPAKQWDITLDYTLRLWSSTEQRDQVGEFINENEAALGFRYIPDRNSYRFAKRIQYRAGFNYNSGSLKIAHSPIDSYSITAGLGIPLRANSLSSINLFYGYTQKGENRGILIEEQIHSLNINLSLRDIWFKKRLID